MEGFEALWLKRCLDQRGALIRIFKGSEVRVLKRAAEHTRKFNQLEDRAKSFDDQLTALLKLVDAKQQQHEKKVEVLVQQNCDLLVGSSLLRLSTGFLIFQ